MLVVRQSIIKHHWCAVDQIQTNYPFIYITLCFRWRAFATTDVSWYNNKRRLQWNLIILWQRQNWHDVTYDIFKCILLNDENVWIPTKISLKCVPKGPINNTQAMVQIMSWHHPVDKPLSEPMMVSLPTHICDTQPQWVNWTLNVESGDNISQKRAGILVTLSGELSLKYRKLSDR